MISLRGVGHSFGDRIVLRGIDVDLDEPRVAVIGANGSGKSTFARLLNGLVVPDAGSVHIDGLDTRVDGPAIRRAVGFVFTDPDAQIVMPTVAEDVAFSLRRSTFSRAEVRDEVRRVLLRFGLAEHADHPAHLLSGGQKQLLALASVLVTNPSLLVLDEPTTLLDLRNTAQVAGLIASLPQRVVLVTHDLELLAGYDRVLVMDAGTIAFDGTPGPAVSAYRDLVAASSP